MPKEDLQPDPFRPDTTLQGNTPGVHSNQQGEQIITASHGESVSDEVPTADQQSAIARQGIIHSG